MIFCVRGRCPGPLDECGFLVSALLTTTPQTVGFCGNFSLEIGCKSTTFFQTDKIFFQKKSHTTDSQLNIFSSIATPPPCKYHHHIPLFLLFQLLIISLPYLFSPTFGLFSEITNIYTYAWKQTEIWQ